MIIVQYMFELHDIIRIPGSRIGAANGSKNKQRTFFEGGWINKHEIHWAVLGRQEDDTQMCSQRKEKDNYTHRLTGGGRGAAEK